MLQCGTKDSPAKYNDSRKELKFINGSEIIFRYCNAEKDLDNFQGVQFDVIFFDEATQLK
jgi:phage terminase large subunit